VRTLLGIISSRTFTVRLVTVCGSCSFHLVFLISVVPRVLSATRVRFILRVSHTRLCVVCLVLDSRTFVQIPEHPRALCLGRLFCLLAQRHSGASTYTLLDFRFNQPFFQPSDQGLSFFPIHPSFLKHRIEFYLIMNVGVCSTNCSQTDKAKKPWFNHAQSMFSDSALLFPFPKSLLLLSRLLSLPPVIRPSSRFHNSYG
jgi:hypothetical protein